MGATFDGVSHNCFLDTGATTTTVKNDSTFSSYASRRDMQFMGINGDTSLASRIFIKDIQMGGKSLGGLEIARLPNEGNYHFTVGVDLLQGRKVLFDFRDLKFQWDPSTETESSFAKGKRGHIVIPVIFGKTAHQMIWDTGAGLTTLDQKIIEQQPGDFEFIRDIEVGNTVGSGKTLMKLYRAKVARVSDASLNDVLVLATDFSQVQAKTGDSTVVGALGFNALRNHVWYFNMPNLRYLVK